MGYDEQQAALNIAKLMRENRELREQLAAAHQRIAELTEENKRFKERIEELERTAARQAAPFRRR